MSKESKDVKAAEGILAIFADEDKKKQAELSRIFLKGFLNYYHYYKKVFYGASDIIEMLEHRLEAIDNALYYLSNHAERKSAEEMAQGLGQILGEFLAIMNYGIPKPDQNLPIAKILGSCRGMAHSLKVLGKGLRPTFIERRAEKIAAEHAGKLSPERQKLFTQIAAIFKTA